MPYSREIQNMFNASSLTQTIIDHHIDLEKISTIDLKDIDFIQDRLDAWEEIYDHSNTFLANNK